jgi:hypothetical protein
MGLRDTQTPDILLVRRLLKFDFNFKTIHPGFLLFAIRITINPVKTQQFILLFSTACFGLKDHHHVDTRIKEYTVKLGYNVIKGTEHFVSL